MAKKKPTRFEEFAQLYGQFRELNGLLEKIEHGGSDPNLHGLLANEIASQEKPKGMDQEDFDRDRSIALNSLPNNLNNPYVTTPILRGIVERSGNEFGEFGTKNLESILKSTPDEVLSGLLQYFTPVKPGDYHGSYRDIAKLHWNVRVMEDRLEALKNPDESEVTKQIALGQIKETVSKHYKSEYADNKAMASYLIALAQYGSDSKFALMKYELMFQEMREDLQEELEGNLPGYLKESLGEKKLLGIYKQLFESQYQKAEGPKKSHVKKKYLYGKEKDTFFPDD